MCCSNVNFKNNILWQNKSINSNTKRRQKHPNFVLLAIVLPVLLTVVLSVLRFTHSDYPFDIFKLLLRHRNMCIISGGHGRSNILHLLLPIQLEAYQCYSCRFNHHTCRCRLDTTCCVWQWPEVGLLFSSGNPVFSTNIFDSYDITEMLLKVMLNTHEQCTICPLLHYDNNTAKKCTQFV